MTMTAAHVRRRGRSWHRVLALMGALVLVVSACGDDSDDSEDDVSTEDAGSEDGAGDGEAEVVTSDLVLGAPADCEENPFCIPGLQEVYGVDLSSGFTALTTEVVPAALREGSIDVGVLFTTDAVLADDDLVPLEDDQGMMAADNVFPVGSQELADAYGEDLAAVLNAVSAELTTDELIELNGRFVNDREDADAIAADWLEEHELAGGRGSQPPDGPGISIGAQEFPESLILSEIYKQALEANGFEAGVEQVGGFRDLLLAAFDSGDVNLAPEYLGAELNFLEEGAATNDADESLALLEPLLADLGLVAYEVSEAVNSNVFVVTQETSDELGLTQLSDLADAG